MSRTKPIFKEVIVVEGKDDVAAVKAACDAQVIATSGLGISREIIDQISAANERQGVIVFTDPDTAGQRIRAIIERHAPGCKHAFLYQDRSGARRAKDRRVGVEYASPDEILEALTRVKATALASRDAVFTMTDLIRLGLAGADNSAAKRDRISRKLAIGQGDCKRFLRGLNDYGVSRDELLSACRESGIPAPEV